MEGGVAAAVGQLLVGAAAEQQPHNVDVALGAGKVQCSAAAVVGGVDIHSAVEQCDDFDGGMRGLVKRGSGFPRVRELGEQVSCEFANRCRSPRR